MSESTPRAGLVQRYRQGDPDAAGELFRDYAQRLSRLAEQFINPKLGGRVEGDDVVQSVFRTFFRRCTAGEFPIDSSAQLWQLLVRITIRKARAQGRRHTAARRDVRVEQSGGDEDWLAAAADREPGPEEAVILLDQIQSLLLGLPDLHCRVLELRLSGYAVAEIADQLHVARQTVYRAMNLLQQRLQASL